jgi:hypothetical protein
VLAERTGRISGTITSPPAAGAADLVTAGAPAAPQPVAGGSAPAEFEFGITTIIAGLRHLLSGDLVHQAPVEGGRDVNRQSAQR